MKSVIDNGKRMCHGLPSIIMSVVVLSAVSSTCRGALFRAKEEDPAYWIKRLGEHYMPNEWFGSGSRTAPVENLVRLGSRKVVPIAVQMLTDRKHITRMGAADALSLFGPAGQPATEALVAVLTSTDEADRVYALAEKALSEIYRPSGTPPPALTQLLESPHELIRARGCATVLRIAPDHVVALDQTRLFFMDTEPRESHATADVPKMVLARALASSPPLARRLARELIGLAETIYCSPRGCKPDHVGIETLHAIAACAPESEEALPTVFRTMGAYDQYTSRAAREAFEAYGPAAMERVEDLLASPNLGTQKQLLLAIRNLGGGQEAIAGYTGHADPVVRVNAQALSTCLAENTHILSARGHSTALAAEAFEQFQREIQILAPPMGADQGPSIRYRDTELLRANKTDAIHIVAIHGGELCLARAYRPWRSHDDLWNLEKAMEWLPTGAFVVVTGYGAPGDATETTISGPFRRYLGAQERLLFLRNRAQTAYAYIGARGMKKGEPLELTNQGQPVVFPASGEQGVPASKGNGQNQPMDARPPTKRP